MNYWTKVIEALEKESEKQTVMFRKMFSVVSAVCVSLMLFCLCNFLYTPWSIVHEMRFEDVIPFYGMTIFYISSIVVYSGAGLICWVCLCATLYEICNYCN